MPYIDIDHPAERSLETLSTEHFGRSPTQAIQNSLMSPSSSNKEEPSRVSQESSEKSMKAKTPKMQKIPKAQKIPKVPKNFKQKTELDDHLLEKDLLINELRTHLNLLSAENQVGLLRELLTDTSEDG